MAADGVSSTNYWLEELDTFKWWKKRRRRRYLSVALLILVLEAFVGIGMFAFAAPPTQAEDIAFGIVGMLGFFLVAFYFLHKWVKSASLKPTDAVKAIVVEKSRFSKKRMKRYENRAYYLTARIDTKLEEGLCEVETYRAVQPGDPVVFFRMNSKQFFAVHIHK